MSGHHTPVLNGMSPGPQVDPAWVEVRFGQHAGIALDSSGIIVAANAKAASLLGRPAGKLVGTPFGILTPVSRRVELDIVTPKGRRRGRVSAQILTRESGDEYAYVRLEEVAVSYRLLSDVMREAVLDVNGSLAAAHRLMVPDLPDTVAVRAESKQILADWFRFLLDFAGGARADIAVTCEARTKSVELRLSLNQAALDPGDAPVLPFPEQSAGLLEEIGGAFCVVADYPTTSVLVTLPAGRNAAA